MPVSYKLRIVVNKIVPEFEELINTMTSHYFDSYIISREIGKDTGKEHLHFYFTMPDPGPQASAVRQYIQKNFGKGNGIYSLSKNREAEGSYPLEYMCYLLKDDPEPRIFNIPIGIMEKVRALDVVMKERKTAVKRSKIQELKELITKKHGYIPNNSEKLVDLILLIHLEQDWLISSFRVETYALTLLCTLNSRFRERLAKDISERMQR